MKEEKIKIEYVKTELLKPYPGNPRDFDDKGKSDLKKSIKKFGWTSPLLVNMAPKYEYVVLSGNLRLIVARELKIPEVPVVKTIITDVRKMQEILLRMNVLNGIFNLNILKDWDIDIVMEAGFNEIDLSAIWDDSLTTESDDFNVDKEIQQIKVPKTKLGEIYQVFVAFGYGSRYHPLHKQINIKRDKL